jgi:hypothetical protein
MTVLRAFLDFPAEAALIGRMVPGYTDLEVDVMNCVKSARQDLDVVLKTMYRVRGESQRLQIADAFGRLDYEAVGLRTEFEMGMGAVRHCLKMRNQYAHSVMWNDNSPQLAISNLEELAALNVEIVDLRGMNLHHVDLPLLQAQFAYFEYASDLLTWVLQEGNRIAGRPALPARQRPAAPGPAPALYL